MIYKISHEVPANTTRDNPDWQKLKICKGTIIQWIIFMPEEAADLLHFTVEYHGVQILPYNRPESIYGLFTPTMIPESLRIDDKPYELDIYAWNTDDTYPHEYNLHVNIEPPKPTVPGTVPTGMIERFKRLFGGGI